MITPNLICSLAATCNHPTGDRALDHLFDTYADNGWSDRYDSPVYYRFLFALSKVVPGLTMVELGARRGAASMHFLAGGGKSAIGIDVQPMHDPAIAGRFEYTAIRGSSVSGAVVSAVEPADIVMIDTDHTYEATELEFQLWRPKVKTGGLMLFDDICAPEYGCTRFWNELEGEKLTFPELHPTDWGFGVLFL